MDKRIELKKLKEMLERQKDLQKYLFVRGFLLTDNENISLSSFPFYDYWNKVKLGKKYFAYTHYKQNIFYIENDNGIFFIFGHAYNPFTMEYDEKVILKKIADNFGTEYYQDCIDELTGVFIFGRIYNEKIEYLVDPSGMQSACYGLVNNFFYLTSHSQIIADLYELEEEELSNELVKYKWYYRVMGPYLPADMTQYKCLKRIVPNIMYSYNGVSIDHNRFYPLKELVECNNDNEYIKIINDAARILKNNMNLISKKWSNPYISLTGGIDSNTTFAAANGIYNKFKTFSYISAEKESIDAQAAKKIANKFNVENKLFTIPDNSADLNNYNEIVQIIDHNNGYIAKGKSNEYRKRVYLMQNLKSDVEVKSWVSETIRAYWYKHYGRTKMPKLSAKLFRNLYKIFIFNRSLAHKVDKVFETYINEFEYRKIPLQYPPADMHYNEVTWGSWGGLNISEMKIYSDITFIYNNRKFLDLMFKIPLKDRIADKHHLDMKKVLNKELYDMNIRVVNMKETKFRAFMLNIIFTINSILPF